jgi:hypothetical protein
MTSALTLAATTHSGSGIPSPITILLVLAGVGYVLWSRMQGRPLKARRLLVLPLLFLVIGVVDLTSSKAPHLSTAAITFLVVSGIVSIVLGAARGITIELFPKDGEIWQRYRHSTVALWISLIGAKIVLTVIAHAAGGGGAAGAGTNSLLLALGLSLLAEAAVIAPRALSTGLPFATGHDRREDRQPPARPRKPRNEDFVGETAPLAMSTSYRAAGRSATPPPSPAAEAQAEEPVWRSPSLHDGADWLRGQVNQSGENPTSKTTAAERLADAVKQHHEEHRERHRDRHDRRRRH